MGSLTGVLYENAFKLKLSNAALIGVVYRNRLTPRIFLEVELGLGFEYSNIRS